MIKRIISDFKLTEISITPNGYEAGYQIIKTNGMIKDAELRKGNLLILNISYKDNIHRVDEIYTDEVKVISVEDGGCFHRMKVSTRELIGKAHNTSLIARLIVFQLYKVLNLIHIDYLAANGQWEDHFITSTSSKTFTSR